MDVLGHDDPCVEFESEASLSEVELVYEDIFGGGIVEERPPVVTGEGEKSRVVGDLISCECFPNREHAS